MPKGTPPDRSSDSLPRLPLRLPPLLRRSWYGLNQAFRQRIAHLEITPDQFSILRWLYDSDPAGLTQRMITDFMTSDPNTITSTLSRMERAGLLVRRPHESDRRAHRVVILPAGRAVYEQASDLANELQSQIMEVLPPGRRETFLKDLSTIADSCAHALDSEPRPRSGAVTASTEPDAAS